MDEPKPQLTQDRLIIPACAERIPKSKAIKKSTNREASTKKRRSCRIVIYAKKGIVSPPASSIDMAIHI